jgi:Plavaka transposase
MNKTTLKFENPETGEESIEYPMYARPIAEWMFDILHDKKLQEACQFDAIEISQYDGSTFDRRYNEPWTGKFWWETQV